MKFKVGQKAQVVSPYTFSGFKDGDIVEISKIIDEDSDFAYYEAKLCHSERGFGYLNEDELEPISIETDAHSISIAPITNGDKIRAMSNREFAEALCSESFDMFMYCSSSVCKFCPHKDTSSCFYSNSCIDGVESWLNSPADTYTD